MLHFQIHPDVIKMSSTTLGKQWKHITMVYQWKSFLRVLGSTSDKELYDTNVPLMLNAIVFVTLPQMSVLVAFAVKSRKVCCVLHHITHRSLCMCGMIWPTRL